MKIYPCTMIFDRYGGCYSNASWTAWPLDAQDIPEGQDDGDVECQEFWHTYTRPVGKGETPNASLRDLSIQLKGGQHGQN